jgi:glutathione S-transferase
MKPERSTSSSTQGASSYSVSSTRQGMERHLADRPFLVAERFTIADIALYAYTHVADEAGFELEDYPAIGAWLERVAAQPGHVTINTNESAQKAE